MTGAAEDPGAADLDPHARRFLRLLAAAEAGRGAVVASPDVAARRKSLEDLAVLAGGTPIPLPVVETLTLNGPGGPLAVRRYAHGPAEAARSPGLVYLHGGGWCAGSLDTHDSVCRTLAHTGGLTVLSVDYRLAPEHPFPAGLEDALYAVEQAAADPERFGVDPTRLGIAGDSAGAALAAGACAALRDQGGPAIALQLLICPILDLGEARSSRTRFGQGFFLTRAAFEQDVADYLPAGGDAADPRVSPLQAASLADLPPAHVHVAACDPFRDEGLAYAARLSAGGVETLTELHPGMIHYFYALPGLIPYARPSLEAMARAARTALG